MNPIEFRFEFNEAFGLIQDYKIVTISEVDSNCYEVVFNGKTKPMSSGVFSATINGQVFEASGVDITQIDNNYKIVVVFEQCF